VYRLLRHRPPGGAQRWTRTNYRGRTLDLLGGPAAAAGVLTGALLARAPGALVAGGTAAGLGLYDDLVGGTHARGIGGHLRALRDGEVTSGLVKMLGLAAGGLTAAALGPAPRRGAGGGASGAGGWLVDGALIAGTANLLNLLDLRPGRAVKVSVVTATALAAGGGPAGTVAAAVTGTACSLLPEDLAERTMIGDSGANALGAALGWAVTARCAPAGRLAALAAVAGLTLASERVSFSAVIERTPVLAAADAWGRLPA
jgi:hypothetical protein